MCQPSLRTGLLLSALFDALLLWNVSCSADKQAPEKKRPPVTVEAADIERRPIDDVRSFSGTLEASQSFVASPKIGGRVERITVDIGDPVENGAVVARLDDDELKQAVARAQADLSVAKANLAKAESGLQIAERTMQRTQTLRDRGVASDADLDDAQTRLLTEKSQETVYRAQLTRARATLKSAKIQVGYAAVAAVWESGETRWVAERFIDEGDTVTANTPLLRIVALTPITAVFFVTEQDYPLLKVQQTVDLTTDAFPNETFTGAIARMAPVFENNTRQARVEVTLPNTDLRLRPGMFVTARVTVAQVDSAVVVPADALVTRDDTQGVFLLAPDGDRVVWRPVQVGVRSGDKLQIKDPGLRGRVVTLGQQLLENGSAVILGTDPEPAPRERNGAP